MPAPITPNVGPALDAVRRNAARRAIDDPAKLAKAARIVRLALERQRLTIEDLTGPESRPSTSDGA